MIKFALLFIIAGIFPCFLFSKEAFSLYKIVSVENWKASATSDTLRLSSEDNDFIHFSTHDQLDAICKKYWSHVPEYVILKVDPSKLPGNLVLEANPGGTNKYYHLYDGSIPLNAILNINFINR